MEKRYIGELKVRLRIAIFSMPLKADKTNKFYRLLEAEVEIFSENFHCIVINNFLSGKLADKNQSAGVSVRELIIIIIVKFY